MTFVDLASLARTVAYCERRYVGRRRSATSRLRGPQRSIRAARDARRDAARSSGVDGECAHSNRVARCRRDAAVVYLETLAFNTSLSALGDVSIVANGVNVSLAPALLTFSVGMEIELAPATLNLGSS